MAFVFLLENGLILLPHSARLVQIAK